MWPGRLQSAVTSMRAPWFGQVYNCSSNVIRLRRRPRNAQIKGPHLVRWRMSDAPAPQDAQSPAPRKISTGLAGLDDILDGGVAPNRLYLIEGMPGSGKTTMALQFLIAGRCAGERC